MKSVLIIDGNAPKALLDSTLYGADAIMYDLYDSVAESEKDAARILMQEALSFFDFGTSGVFVRVNPMAACGAEDIAVTGKGKPHAFVIPVADKDTLVKAEKAVATVEAENGFEAGSIKLVPTLETVASVENAGELLTSSPRICAALFNAGGFLRDLGVDASADSDQLVYARSKVALACRAAGIPALDTPYLNLKDPEGLKADAAKAKSLGFCGKVAAGGGQVPVINALFA